MVTPKSTWKRLHELTTGPVAWHDYLAAVEQYTQDPPPKRKRRKRGKRKKRSNLDQQ